MDTIQHELQPRWVARIERHHLPGGGLHPGLVEEIQQILRGRYGDGLEVVLTFEGIELTAVYT